MAIALVLALVGALVAGQVSAGLSGNALVGWLCGALTFLLVMGAFGKGPAERERVAKADAAARELAERRIWVKEYPNAQEFDRDAQQMANDGWQLSQQSQGSTHMNVGRTVFSTIATGGLNLVTPKIGGASYTKGKLTATWVRPAV